MIPFSLLGRLEEGKQPDVVSRCLYSSGVAALTAGSVFQGVLEIYGTTNRLSAVYWILGALLLFAGVILYAIKQRRS